MQLFLQLNASDVPDEAQSLIPNGILQFFYCTNNDPHCEVDCEAFFPFSKAILIRVVEPGPYRELSESPVEDAFPARSIKGWTPLKDFPNWEESESLGIACTDDESDLLGELGIPYAGEKLGGWPAWVQSIEYPDCPECDAPMDLVFQFASEENLPYMFGDVGTGHVTRCKSHPEILTFGWAC